MWNHKPSFRFEIGNFSKRVLSIVSEMFVAGRCEWFLVVHPHIGGQMSVDLNMYVADKQSLGTGWKRTASFYYVALNQSGKELYRSPVELSRLFQDDIPGCRFLRTLLPPNFHEKEGLENDRLILEIYINVVEAVDRERRDASKQKEIVDISCFQGFPSQVSLDNYLLEEVCLKRNKSNDADGSRVQQLEKRVKNIELMDLGSLKSKLEELSLERKKADADGSRIQQLEESVKNLELIVSDLKAELEKEKAKSSDAGFLLVDYEVA